MTTATPDPTPKPGSRVSYGTIGFLFGALALIIVVVQFYVGPFAPQQSAGVSIGEMAAEISESATRALLGQEQPAPEARPWDIDRIIKAVSAVLAAFAVILGAVGFIFRESRRLTVAAVLLGVSAIILQFFVWLALAILGVILVGMILQFMDGILG